LETKRTSRNSRGVVGVNSTGYIKTGGEIAKRSAEVWGEKGSKNKDFVFEKNVGLVKHNTNG